MTHIRISRSLRFRRATVQRAVIVLVALMGQPALAHDFANTEIIGSDGCCFRWNYHWHSHPDEYVFWPAVVGYTLWISRVNVASSFSQWVDFGNFSGAIASGDANPLINDRWYKMRVRYFLPFVPNLTAWFGQLYVARTVCGTGAIP